jgi:DHA2 family multidrug resistance protein
MRGVGNFLSFLVVAQLTRRNPRATLAAGLVIQAFAAAWMGQLDINMTAGDVLMTNLIHGFGFGLAYTPMAVLTFSTLEGRLLTQGNAIFSLLRMLGSSIFIAIVLVVFVRSSAEAHAELASLIGFFKGDILSPWTAMFGELNSPLLRAKLSEEVRRQAAMIGYINAFHFLMLLPALAVPATLLFRLPKSTT